MIEFVRRQVGRRHHHHAKLEQPREQAAEDHGVGNVGDVKFVETQQPGFFRDCLGGAGDRVRSGIAVLRFLPKHMNALVHVGHELVEMHTPLAFDRTGLEKQIHQQRLAATDLAVDVEPANRFAALLPLGEQPTERGRFLRQKIALEPQFKRRQVSRQHLLTGVGLDLSGGNKRRVARAEEFGHWCWSEANCRPERVADLL